MGIPRLPAAALLVLLLVVAGAAAQEEAVAAVHAGLKEIAAKARAQREQAAVLEATLSALEARIVNITQECTETLKKVIGEMSQTITTLQNEHANLAVNSLLQKASEQSLQAKERAKPHMETAKEKWIPVIKENWATAKTNTEPYVQMVSAKSAEVYQASRDAISPHVLKAHEFADPYFQEAKKLSKPYIDEVAKASKPHVEKLKTTLKPYTDKAGDAYEKFLETANYIISRKSREAERK